MAGKRGEDPPDAEFAAAVTAVTELHRDPGNATKLRLYALYKQATVGDVTGRRPGFTDPVGRAKYDAWSSVAGLSPEQARRDYVSLARELGA